MRLARPLLAFLAALVVVTLVGVAASSLSAAARLVGLGIEVPVTTQAWMVGHDLLGMGPAYALVMGIGLALAFPAAGVLAARLRPLRPLVFALAGAVAVVVALLLMRQLMGVTLIAGARSGLGVAAQAAGGLLAGLAFAWLKPARRTV